MKLQLFLSLIFVAGFVTANPIGKKTVLHYSSLLDYLSRIFKTAKGAAFNDPELNPDLFQGDILGIDPLTFKQGDEVSTSRKFRKSFVQNKSAASQRCSRPRTVMARRYHQLRNSGWPVQ